MSFPPIEQRRNQPNDNNRSGHEIEEKFCDGFGGEIRYPRAHSKEPLKGKKKWEDDRNCNIDCPKPATTEQRERSCDECQERKRPNGRWPRRLEATNRDDSEPYGRDERKSAAVPNSTDESCGNKVRVVGQSIHIHWLRRSRIRSVLQLSKLSVFSMSKSP
jgi:hypothetical protein